MNDTGQPTFWGITFRTIVIHTVTYFFIGLLAFTLFNYSARFADPTLSSFMRQTNDPLVMAGVLFQPFRGLLFGIVFWLFRDSLFSRPYGWLKAWGMLVIVGIFSTFGPAPGSVEGIIYTKIPIEGQLGGLIEVLAQSLLLSVLTIYWVKHSHIRWLNWVLSVIFFIVLLLPLLGLFARQVDAS
jgi:hypothetical protein